VGHFDSALGEIAGHAKILAFVAARRTNRVRAGTSDRGNHQVSNSESGNTWTDLDNFTTLSENLDPAEVSEILTAYFEQTTRCVLENKGTIIKYIGDAVMATFPTPDRALPAAANAGHPRGVTERR